MTAHHEALRTRLPDAPRGLTLCSLAGGEAPPGARCERQARILPAPSPLRGVSSHALMEPPADLGPSLCAMLFSLVTCPGDSSHLGPPGLSDPASQIGESTRFPNLSHQPGNPLQAVRALLFLDHCPSLPDAQCLQNWAVARFAGVQFFQEWVDHRPAASLALYLFKEKK